MSEPPRDLARIGRGFLNALLVLVMVVVPAIFGFKQMPTEMGIQIGAIALALFFLNIEKFVRFKGPGIEAEIREAKTVVDKAYAALDDLKNLGLALAEPIINSYAVLGRLWQHIPLKYKLADIEKIKTRLQQLGASEIEITSVCSTMTSRLTEDHIRSTLNALKEANPDKESIFEGVNDWNFQSWDKGKLTAFIRDNSLKADGEPTEWIADLDQFLSKGTLRREDKWQS
jgi:hypothetical protein